MSADAANASKDSASNGDSNGRGETLAGDLTFSSADGASLSAAMKIPSEKKTYFASVNKPTTPAKGTFQETKVASGEKGETTVHKLQEKVSFPAWELGARAGWVLSK